MSVYVTDTHPLVYYAGRNKVQLSDIMIPAPALWEVSMLEQAGHIKLRKPFREWTRDLLRNPCFEFTLLDAEIITEARDYHFNNDIFDAVIVATARLRDLPLITKDMDITGSGLVEIYW